MGRRKGVAGSSDPTNSRKSSTASTITEQAPLENSESVPARTPKAEEDIVDPRDSGYFYYFLSGMPAILPYTSLFPSIVTEVFMRSVLHITLRHSVLSISSMIVDYRCQRSMERFHWQYGTSIRKINASISSMDIDEGIIIAVFLITWIDVVRAELRASRKHLNGLNLLLQEIQKKYRYTGNDGALVEYTGGTGLTPLIMQLWRIAIRLDFTTSLYLVQPPVFPPIPSEQQELHRQWIILSTPDDASTEWALATFAQDDLMHRACHLASRARDIRKSASYTSDLEQKILEEVTQLEAESDNWHRRQVVAFAEQLEQGAQLDPDADDAQPSFSCQGDQPWSFVDFPPRRIINTFYANLAISARAVSIYISLIAYPIIGAGPNPQRFLDAVEICRTLAGLGEDKTHTASSKVWVMFLAGVAFGGDEGYEEGTNWLLWRLQSIVRMFPLMKNAVKAYSELWKKEGDFWDEMDRIAERLYIN